MKSVPSSYRHLCALGCLCAAVTSAAWAQQILPQRAETVPATGSGLAKSSSPTASPKTAPPVVETRTVVAPAKPGDTQLVRNTVSKGTQKVHSAVTGMEAFVPHPANIIPPMAIDQVEIFTPGSASRPQGSLPSSVIRSPQRRLAGAVAPAPNTPPALRVPTVATSPALTNSDVPVAASPATSSPAVVSTPPSSTPPAAGTPAATVPTITPVPLPQGTTLPGPATAASPATPTESATPQSEVPAKTIPAKTVSTPSASGPSSAGSEISGSPNGSSSTTPAPVITTPAVTTPAVPADPLVDLVQQAIEVTSKRRLTAGVHTPWQVVHGILALRWELRLWDPKDRKDVSAIEWLMSGQTFDGQPMWQVTPHGGRGHPFTRPYAFEGHPTQFMGYMTLANIPLDYEIQADKGIITVRDIINDAKMNVREGPEVTWTLWAISHYEDPEATWRNIYGEPWSIERMVRIQTAEQVTTGACGGCHGLFALAYARNMYLSTGKPLRGTWLEADQKVKRYIQEAKALQNPDGSFSSNHFRGPGFSTDFATRITTSGHQLEWLLCALPQSKLKDEWVRKGVEAVARDLIEHRNDPSDCGPMYHALDALMVYRQRTVPGYEYPRRNSHLKLADRGKPFPLPVKTATRPTETSTSTPASPAVNVTVPPTLTLPMLPVPMPSSTDAASAPKGETTVVE